MLEIMWSVAFLTSGVFLCRVVSYEFSKGLTAHFSFSLLHVRVKVGGYHEVSLDFGQVLEISSGSPGHDSNALGAESDKFFWPQSDTVSLCPLEFFWIVICHLSMVRLDRRL